MLLHFISPVYKSQLVGLLLIVCNFFSGPDVQDVPSILTPEEEEKSVKRKCVAADM
jgi:hypothetical protein